MKTHCDCLKDAVDSSCEECGCAFYHNKGILIVNPDGTNILCCTSDCAETFLERAFQEKKDGGD